MQARKIIDEDTNSLYGERQNRVSIMTFDKA